MDQWLKRKHYVMLLIFIIFFLMILYFPLFVKKELPLGNGSVARADNRCVQVDGLRGIAAIMVVLSHVHILDQGGVANAIFFAITGFLFINPYKNDYERKYLSPKNILKFYLNRALRILPFYYIVLIAVVLITGFKVIPKEQWIHNLYFTDWYDHLWYIHALVRNYLIMPVVMMAFVFLSDRIRFLQNDIVRSLFFLVLGALVRNEFIFLDIFDIRICQFMVGISAGYMFRYLLNNPALLKKIQDMRVAGNTLFISLFLAIILSSCNVTLLLFPDIYFRVGLVFPFFTSIFAAILLLAVVIYDKGTIGKLIGSRPLLFFGKITLPLYLIHWFFLPVFRSFFNKYLTFVFALAVSSFLSWILDLLVSKVTGKLKSKKPADQKTANA